MQAVLDRVKYAKRLDTIAMFQPKIIPNNDRTLCLTAINGTTAITEDMRVSSHRWYDATCSCQQKNPQIQKFHRQRCGKDGGGGDSQRKITINGRTE